MMAFGNAASISKPADSDTGAYALPKLKGSNGFRLYDDLDNEWVFEVRGSDILIMPCTSSCMST